MTDGAFDSDSNDEGQPGNEVSESGRGRENFDGDLLREQLRLNLDDLARYRMPFGRYQDRPLHELPLEYLQWFRDRAGGFPAGRLGELMAFVCQIKSDGAEIIFEPLRSVERRGRSPIEGPRRRRINSTRPRDRRRELD